MPRILWRRGIISLRSFSALFCKYVMYINQDRSVSKSAGAYSLFAAAASDSRLQKNDEAGNKAAACDRPLLGLKNSQLLGCFLLVALHKLVSERRS